MQVKMTCGKCGKGLTSLTHKPLNGLFVCPQCGETVLDYVQGANVGEMDEPTFSKHFAKVSNKQKEGLRKLFPQQTPKEVAASHFITEVLLQFIRQQVILGLFPESAPGGVVALSDEPG